MLRWSPLGEVVRRVGSPGDRKRQDLGQRLGASQGEPGERCRGSRGQAGGQGRGSAAQRAASLGAERKWGCPRGQTD